MSRITDIEPQDDSEIVNRLVAQIHKSLDIHFPDTRSAQSKHFSKTAFSRESEDTVVEMRAPKDSSEESSNHAAETPKVAPRTSTFSRLDEFSVTGNTPFTIRSNEPKNRAIRLMVWLVLIGTLGAAGYLWLSTAGWSAF